MMISGYQNKLLPTIKALLVIILISAYLPALFATTDLVAKKFKGKVQYLKSNFERKVAILKKQMLKDYKDEINNAFKTGDLLKAESISKKINELESKVKKYKLIKLDFSPPPTPVDYCFGNTKSGNLALAANGATAKAPSDAEKLIDGNSTKYDENSGFASGTCPCDFIIALNQIYSLEYIRFLLWDGDHRFYTYKLFTSVDGENWDLLSDKSKGKHKSWQEISFKRKNVKYIKVHGLQNSANTTFHIVEIEAYCNKP